MSNENADQLINTGVADIDHLKIQTAEALEEAARNLRRTNVAEKGEDLKHVLRDIEAQVDQFKANLGEDYQKIEFDYQKNTKSLEHVIIDHPVPSVLVAAGVGLLIGMAICKVHK
ncbi:MAG: hypothetical protein V1862_02495 [Methanobacteriota archaeon]